MPKLTNQKERILLAALALFATQGYSAVGIRRIAKKANVSLGLLYNFFPSKLALLEEIVSRGHEDIKQSMTAYAQLKDPHAAIEHHILKTCELIRQHKEFWRLLHAVRLQGKVTADMKRSFEKIIDEVTRIFKEVFKKLHYPKPELEAILLLTQIDGIVLLFLQDNETPIDQLARHLIKRYKQ